MNFDNSGDFDSPSNPTSQPVFKLEAFSSSPELGKLFEALAKAQAEMKPAVMDMKNPHYNNRYASLTACQEAYKGPLAANGLALTQQVFSIEARYFIRSCLGHASGQWQANIFELLIDRRNMQGLGSAITYARRYGANSLVGVVDTEDDDAEGGVGNKPQDKKASPPPAQKPQPQAPEAPPKTPIVTPAQLARLFAIANKNGWTNEQIKIFMERYYGIGSTKDLSRGQYDELIDIVQKKAFDQAVSPLDAGPEFFEAGSNG